CALPICGPRGPARGAGHARRGAARRADGAAPGDAVRDRRDRRLAARRRRALPDGRQLPGARRAAHGRRGGRDGAARRGRDAHPPGARRARPAAGDPGAGVVPDRGADLRGPPRGGDLRAHARRGARLLGRAAPADRLGGAGGPVVAAGGARRPGASGGRDPAPREDPRKARERSHVRHQEARKPELFCPCKTRGGGRRTGQARAPRARGGRAARAARALAARRCGRRVKRPALPPRPSGLPPGERALAEDLGAGDVTSASVIPAAAVGAAVVEARQPLVACGLPIAEAVFRAVDPTLEVERVGDEGEARERDQPLLHVRGRLRSILAAERTALNFLGRMCGVATWTRRFVQAVADTGCRVLDTRKTLPGWRVLDKYATAVGGADNHRGRLDDAVLIKDNHVAAVGGVGAAVRAARAAAPPHLRILV